MTHPNADLVRALFEAFNSQDWDAFGQSLSPDVVWHGREGGAALEGREAVVSAISTQTVEWVDDVHDVVANDDHAVALVNSHVTAGDRSIEFKFVEVFHMSGGQITERWAFTSEPTAVGEFFASIREAD